MAEFASNSELTVEEGIALMVETDLLASFKWMKNLLNTQMICINLPTQGIRNCYVKMTT